MAFLFLKKSEFYATLY